MGRILQDILIMAVAAVTIWFIYVNYWDNISFYIFGDAAQTIYIGDLAVSVSVADEPEERRQGLSGVENLDELEGKLFIFDEEGYYSIWMKDMLIPLDIIWINNDFEIVHIEEKIEPDSFPETFVSDEPARFVLEVNSYFVDVFKISEGDIITMPPNIIPRDILPGFRE